MWVVWGWALAAARTADWRPTAASPPPPQCSSSRWPSSSPRAPSASSPRSRSCGPSCVLGGGAFLLKFAAAAPAPARSPAHLPRAPPSSLSLPAVCEREDRLRRAGGRAGRRLRRQRRALARVRAPTRRPSPRRPGAARGGCGGGGGGGAAADRAAHCGRLPARRGGQLPRESVRLHPARAPWPPTCCERVSSRGGQFSKACGTLRPAATAHSCSNTVVA